MAHVTTTWPRSWAPGRFPPIRPVWLILLGLALLAVTAWAIYNGVVAQRQAVPTYQTAQVTRGNLVAAVSAPEPRTHGAGPKRVVVVDCGCKNNIVRALLKRNLTVRVVRERT